MNYKTIKCNNYDIFLIKTDKFKTINISTILLSDFKEENITKDIFISDYLVNSNNLAKDEVSMSKKYMELYEPSLSINDFYTDLHHKIYSLTFLNEKYTEKDMNKKTIDFYYNILFNPNVDNESFNENNFNIIKSKMISSYKMDEEDSRGMAFFHSFSNVSDDLPIRLDVRGKMADLLKIDIKNLKEYYFNELDNSKFLVFVVGNYDDNIIDYIKENLDDKVKENDYELKPYFDVTKVKKVNKVVEEKDFNQSIVFLIYKIIGMTKREGNFVLPILNNILGGNSAKLFNNVREKNSLAYYAYSNFSQTNNILYMYAGISKENYEKCSKLMQEQLKEIIGGNITDEEIESAKSTLESSILFQYDSIGALSNNLKGQVIYNYPSLDQNKEGYLSVTKEEVIELSKKLELDVDYLLKGVKE